MSNTVLKIEESDAQRLADNNLESFVNDSTGEYFTYTDLGSSPYITGQKNEVELTETLNYGTWPVRKNKRMFPR